uniref:peroxidase n=1 Tax=Syphacia muris TaxID=451379 RepID=A0A0N5AN51_9BILA
MNHCVATPEWMLANCQISCKLCFNQEKSSVNGPIDSLFRKSKNFDECEVISKTPETIAGTMTEKNLITPNEENFPRQMLSADDIARAAAKGCVPQLTSIDCLQSLCYHLYYRSFDGACNNLKNSLKGAAFRPYLRQLPPVYDDGNSEPVGSMKPIRPSARDVSRLVLSSRQEVDHSRYSAMVMQFGQFVSHDIAKTSLQPTAQCSSCKPIPSKCMITKLASSDPNSTFKKRGCIRISRSAPVCGLRPRQQLNENTAFIDASTLYGSSPKDISKFRDRKTGFLKMNRFKNQIVLPFDAKKCPFLKKCTASFVAGDGRASLFLGLSSLHILFAREHNRIVSILHKINPKWSADRLFQEVRKIVGAEIQVIVYNEFLPKLLGDALDVVVGSYTGYNPEVDPSISNVFSAAAYRFGHGMLQEFYARLDSNYNNTLSNYAFGDGVFKIGKILFEGGIDPILRGLVMTPAKKPHRLTTAITEKMFGNSDLGTINIMRGRDHGIPSYNEWRRFCSLKHASTFDDLRDEILDERVRTGLSKVYKTPDDIDLYVGAMLEDPVNGGLVGTTLSCLIGDQFKRLRDGDRFYYENPGVFTAAQLFELRKVTLSRILCYNGDNIDMVPKDAFVFDETSIVACNNITEVDLKKWKN